MERRVRKTMAHRPTRCVTIPMNPQLWDVEYKDHQKRLAEIEGSKFENHAAAAPVLGRSHQNSLSDGDAVNQRHVAPVSLLDSVDADTRRKLEIFAELIARLDSEDGKALVEEICAELEVRRLLACYSGVFPSLRLGRKVEEEREKDSFCGSILLIENTVEYDESDESEVSQTPQRSTTTIESTAVEFVVSPPLLGRPSSSNNIVLVTRNIHNTPTPPSSKKPPRGSARGETSSVHRSRGGGGGGSGCRRYTVSDENLWEKLMPGPEPIAATVRDDNWVYPTPSRAWERGGPLYELLVTGEELEASGKEFPVIVDTEVMDSDVEEGTMSGPFVAIDSVPFATDVLPIRHCDTPDQQLRTNSNPNSRPNSASPRTSRKTLTWVEKAEINREATPTVVCGDDESAIPAGVDDAAPTPVAVPVREPFDSVAASSTHETYVAAEHAEQPNSDAVVNVPSLLKKRRSTLLMQFTALSSVASKRRQSQIGDVPGGDKSDGNNSTRNSLMLDSTSGSTTLPTPTHRRVTMAPQFCRNTKLQRATSKIMILGAVRKSASTEIHGVASESNSPFGNDVEAAHDDPDEKLQFDNQEDDDGAAHKSDEPAARLSPEKPNKGILTMARRASMKSAPINDDPSSPGLLGGVISAVFGEDSFVDERSSRNPSLVDKNLSVSSNNSDDDPLDRTTFSKSSHRATDRKRFSIHHDLSKSTEEAAHAVPCGEKGPNYRYFDIFHVGTLPIGVSVSRLLIYLSNVSIGAADASPTASITAIVSEAKRKKNSRNTSAEDREDEEDDDEELHKYFQKTEPHIQVIQDLYSPSLEPSFVLKSHDIWVSNDSVAIAVIECCSTTSRQWFTYGYSVLPLGHHQFRQGNYFSRLRAGDPRVPAGFLTADGTPVFDASRLLDHYADCAPSEYVPLGFVCWGNVVNVDGLHGHNFVPDPQDPPRSEAEQAIAADIVAIGLNACPHDWEIASVEQAEKHFEEYAHIFGHQEPDAVCCIAPFNEDRSVFINVESINGIECIDGIIYKVHVEMACASEETAMQYTRQNDFFSPTATDAPVKFLDSPMMFSGVPSDDPLAIVIFRVFAVDMNAFGKRSVELVGFGASKIFVEEGVLRQGRFTVPLFNGAPPEDFLEDTMKAKLEKCVYAWSNAAGITFMKPLSLLSFSIGDEARMKEVMSKRGWHIDPRMVLVPRARKKSFIHRRSKVDEANTKKSGKPLHEALGIPAEQVPEFSAFINARFDAHLTPPVQSGDGHTGSQSDSRSGSQVLKQGNETNYKASVTELVKVKSEYRASAARSTTLRTTSIRRFSSPYDDLSKAWEVEQSVNAKAKHDEESRSHGEAVEAGPTSTGQIQPFFQAFGDEVQNVDELPKFDPDADEYCFTIDTVGQVPLTAAATRVLVYLSDAVVGDEKDGPLSPSLSSDELFHGPPSILALQDVDSSCLEPKFTIGNEAIFWARSKSTALVIVECLSLQKHGNFWFTYGHCVVPVGNPAYHVGNFFTRLRPGDPRVISLTSDGVPFFDKSSLQVPTLPTAHNYVPLCFVRWRGNIEKMAPLEDPQQPGKSVEELTIANDVAAAAGMFRRPVDVGCKTKEKVSELFAAATEAFSHEHPDVVCNIAPYNPERATFVNIESISGWVAEPGMIYKVHVEVASAASGNCMQYTQLHDFAAPDGLIAFLDFPMIFTSVLPDPFGLVIFRVFEIDTTTTGFDGIKMVAWSLSKVLASEGVLRQGRFAVPLFSGVPPDDFLNDTMAVAYEKVVLQWEAAGEIVFVQPMALLFFSLGDQARVPEITGRKGFHMESRMVLVPKKKPSFIEWKRMHKTSSNMKYGSVAATSAGDLKIQKMTNQRFEKYLS